MFFPRTYVDITVEVVDDERVRFAILDSPVFDEADDYHWFAQLGGASDRALDAIVQAVNPRARVTTTDGAAGRAVRLRSGDRPERDAGAARRPRSGSRRSAPARRSSSALGGPCAQLELEHLAARVQRQRVDDLDPARRLVVRHPLAAPRDEVRFGRSRRRAAARRTPCRPRPSARRAPRRPPPARSPGCSSIIPSISAGYALNPPTMNMSFIRSVMREVARARPSPPMSPVCSQPSASIASAVASGSWMNPRMTL